MRFCSICEKILEEEIECGCKVATDNCDINFNISFTCVKCDKCEEIVEYNPICSKCSMSIDEVLSDIDPTYILREGVFGGLPLSIKRIDDFKKDYQDIKYDLEYIDFLEYISSLTKATRELMKLSRKHPLKNTRNINVNENLEYCKDLNIKIIDYLDCIFNIYKSFNEIKIPRIFINIHTRANEAIENLLNSIRWFIKILLAKRFRDLKVNQNKPQEYLNAAAESLRWLEQHINSFCSIENTGNIATILASISKENSSKNTYEENVNIIEEDVFEYFEKFMTIELKHITPGYLMDLVNIKSLSMTRFVEKRFNKKIEGALKILVVADKNNEMLLKKSFSEYYESYQQVCIKFRGIQVLEKFNLDNNITDELYIGFILQSYKSIGEGVFRDISNIIIQANKIAKRKTPYSNEEIKNRGYAEKLEDFKVSSELKLYSQNDETIKLIRNAVAHDTYEFGEKSVRFINKKEAKGKKINIDKTLSHTEIMDSYFEIVENLFAIKAAIMIFLINNEERYNSEFKTLCDIESKINKSIETIEESMILKGYSDPKVIKNNSDYYISYSNENLFLSLDDILNIGSYIVFVYDNEVGYFNVYIKGADNQASAKIDSKWFYEFNKGEDFKDYNLVVLRNLSYIKVKEEFVCKGIKQCLIEICGLMQISYEENKGFLENEINYIINILEDIKIYNLDIDEIDKFIKGLMVLKKKLKIKKEDFVDLYNIDNKLPVKKKVKVGRNDSCPCGSKKKYKKCCMQS